MTCGLRSLSWNWFLAAYVVLIAVLLFAAPAHAAPSFSVAAVSCPEGGPCAVTIRKSAKAISYSKLQVTTLDGTAKAGIDYAAVNLTLTIGNNALAASAPLTIAARSGDQGNRAFTLHIKALRNAVVAAADAAVTIIESEPAPAPVPSATWVAVALTVGGYACSKVQAADPRSPCGSGIVYRLTGSMMSADAVPVPQFTAAFFQDASGNFPTGDAYSVNVVTYWQASDLTGIAPAP